MPTKKQNLTLCLSQDSLRKAKLLAAKRSTSLRAFVAEQIEIMVRKEQTSDENNRNHSSQ